MVDFAYLGQNARKPSTAAGLVAILALVFNVVWVFSPPAMTVILDFGRGGILFVVFVGAVNAYITTWYVWRRYVTRPDALSVRRGVGVGLLLSVVSMATFFMAGYLAVGASSLLTSGSIPPGFGTGNVAEYVLYTPVIGGIGIILGFVATYGIQILICVGCCAWLARLERRSTPPEYRVSSSTTE